MARMNHQSPEFARNLGFISSKEQQTLNESTVAIAGAGGDGGALAIQLARLGVGEIRLADPDPFEAENINRQAACTTKTIGVNKAQAVAGYINDINPHIDTKVYIEGVTEGNLGEFIEGSDLVIDETEFTMHAIGVAIARQARQKEIPNLMAMNIGFGTTVTSFDPHGYTFEKFLGLDDRLPVEELSKQQVPLRRWLAYLPDYVDINVLKKVDSGVISAPSVAPGVSIAAGVGSTQALLHLLSGVDNNRPKPIVAPHVYMADAMTGESRVIKRPSISYAKSLLRVVIANGLGRNPVAG